MSSNFSNFAEKNPFEDPAVLEALKIEPSSQGTAQAVINQVINQNVDQAISQAILGPPPPYNPSTSYDITAASEMRRKQDELERKAAELQRREDEMQRNVQMQARRNNFPPLPSFCPFQPCFYQDISIEIPLQFQQLIKMGYYLWLAYIGLLSVNVVGCMIYLISSSHNSLNNASGSTFILSIFLTIIFTPCSFICWFRPLYNAFRVDSSFSFFLFFFIFFFQCCTSIIQAFGISGWGTVGLLNSAEMFGCGSGGCIFAGILMLLIGLAFALLAVMDAFLLLKIHRIYRSTGATFSKAQQELTTDILTNSTFQQAARNFISGQSTTQHTATSINNLNSNPVSSPVGGEPGSRY